MRRAAKVLGDFDLTTREGRYDARRHGFDVPKRKAGPAPVDVWSRIDTTTLGCWPWTGRVNRDGYGTFHSHGTKMAHRAAWESINGAIPPGLIVRHTCDNPRCCRPTHMLLGSHADNSADRVARDRQAKGEALASSKLTETDVRAIREMYVFRRVLQSDIAAQFGVCRNLIHKIVSRKYWRHVA